jgi:predicted ATPase/DNA-binding XRE family transcriptional regulator
VSKNILPADMPPDVSFGELLRRFRRNAGLTQEELAERANVSARAISDLERGAKQGPHRTTVTLIAGALRLSADDRALLDRSARRARGPMRAVASVRSMAVLPVPPTPLVGRKRDVEEVVHRVRWGGVRLLTLTGPGGVGKTRVALAATHTLRNDCPGGPTYVSLAPLRDVRLVAPTIARELGLRESGGRIEDALIAHLQQRDAIVVLDNFEHLAKASTLVSALVHQCPRLRLIVTSRSALRLQGEHRMEIAPLEVPEDGELAETAMRFPAVELFAQRAQAARRDFALRDDNLAAVVEICRRLDGLPLAIELAAARLPHLSPQALLMRLSRRLTLLTDGPADLPARQQTMRDTIAWSYELLGDPERRLLRHLSVFAGGWSLEGAEAVGTDSGTEALSLLAGLNALVDKSLIVVDESAQDEPRYRMLETIREFAGEQLSSTEEAAAVRERHARYFAALAEEAEPFLTGSEQAQWLERLEIEHDNLRVALGWAQTADGAELGLRLSAALRLFWFGHGHIDEGRQWLETFLPLLDRASSPLLQARVLYSAGAIAYMQARHDEARQHFEASLALYRALGDTTEVGVTLNGLGVIASSKGEYERALTLLREAAAIHRSVGNDALLAAPLTNLANIARYQGQHAAAMGEAIALYEEGSDIYRRTGNVTALANTLNNLALVLADTGETERAIQLADESLALARELDNPGLQGFALTTLCAIALDQGRDAGAWPLAEECLDLFRRAGDRDMTAISLINLGTLEFRRGRHDRAEELAREAQALLQQSGARRLLGYVFGNLGDVTRARGNLRQARVQYEEGLAVWTGVGYVAGVADLLERLAGLACAEGSWEPAARQYAMAATLRERIGVPMPPVYRAEAERDCARIQEMLGVQAFNAAWQEGVDAAIA